MTKDTAQPKNEKKRLASFIALGVLAIGTFLALNMLDFPFSVAWMQKMAGGHPILDARFHYSLADVHTLFDALGEHGRATYLKFLVTVDLLLPALFGSFLFAAVKRGDLARYRWLALSGTALDYLENIAIVTLLLLYLPGEAGMDWLVKLAAILTGAKQVAYWAAVGLAIVGGFVRPKALVEG